MLQRFLSTKEQKKTLAANHFHLTIRSNMNFQNKIIADAILLFSLLFFPLAGKTQTSSEHYHLLENITLGGDGGWDYLTFDNAERRLFISHGTRVMVYDIGNKKIAGEISNTEGVHGIAIANESGHGFTSNGKSNSVLMFDLKTLDTLKRIAVGVKPDAIIYDPFSKIVIACNGGSDNATLIDASTGNVKTTIALGGGPEFAVSDGKGHVYINIEDKNEVVDIDMKNFKVLHHWGLKGGEGPTGIAMDILTHRLFIGCANKLMVIVNSDNGKIVGELPIGKGVDAVVFDPEKKVALSSNGEGTLTVVKEINSDKFEVTETVSTLPGARTETIDLQTHDVFLVTADFGPAPEPTKEHPHPRPAIIPQTFKLLKYSY
jgi:DNA-binding beta-propeller fold protein YncE